LPVLGSPAVCTGDRDPSASVHPARTPTAAVVVGLSLRAGDGSSSASAVLPAGSGNSSRGSAKPERRTAGRWVRRSARTGAAPIRSRHALSHAAAAGRARAPAAAEHRWAHRFGRDDRRRHSLARPSRRRVAADRSARAVHVQRCSGIRRGERRRRRGALAAASRRPLRLPPLPMLGSPAVCTG